MMCAIIRAVVVFPLLPVTATIGMRASAPGGKSMSMTGLATYWDSPSVGCVCMRKPGRGVDLHDPAAGLAHRHADIGADQVDAGDVEADHLRRQLGELDVVGVRLLGPVDADPAGAHVAGPLEVDARAAWRHVGQLEALLARVRDRLVVELDAGQHLLVADAAPWIGVRALDQLGQRVLAVALDVRGNTLRDRAQDAVDDEASIVVADQVRLHHHRAAPALGACGSEAGTHRLLVVEVEHDATPVVAVERLDRHGQADARGRRHRGILVADQLSPAGPARPSTRAAGW